MCIIECLTASVLRLKKCSNAPLSFCNQRCLANASGQFVPPKAVAIFSFPILGAEWFFIKATRIDGEWASKGKEYSEVNEILVKKDC